MLGFAKCDPKMKVEQNPFGFGQYLPTAFFPQGL